MESCRNPIPDQFARKLDKREGDSFEIWAIELGYFEYFCNACGQLRLSAIKDSCWKGCGNCDSTDVIKARPGTLDEAQLKEAFHAKNSI